jgi:transaldolase
MKKTIELIPLTLLMVLTSYLFFKEPNMAQAAIICALAALSGYNYFLEAQKKPDYVAIFTDRLDAMDAEYKERLDNKEHSYDEQTRFLVAEVNNIREEVGKIKESQNKLNIVKTNEEKARNFKW